MHNCTLQVLLASWLIKPSGDLCKKVGVCPTSYVLPKKHSILDISGVRFSKVLKTFRSHKTILRVQCSWTEFRGFFLTILKAKTLKTLQDKETSRLLVRKATTRKREF